MAFVLGLVLVGSGLYLWRRPQAPADSAAGEAASASAGSLAILAPDGGAAGASAAADSGASSPPVALSEARVISCQDRGSGHTAPDACDRLSGVEQALAGAITQAAACAPGGGTIEYLADVSFSRHKIGLSLPRAGRSVKDRKELRACASAVRGSLQGLGLDGFDHQHARYKIAVTATYRSSTPGR